MLFHSPEFLVFFAVYLPLHFLIPPRYRVWLILIGGTIFYSWWNPWYVWIPLALTMIAYFGAIWLDNEKRSLVRPWKLTVVLVLMALPLLGFKYTNFVWNDVVGVVVGMDRQKLINVGLPLGISFVTFTLIAYVVDSYRGIYPVERRFSVLGAFVVFFPHLIAGPILRPHELLPQFDRQKLARDASFALGILIYTLGLIKKTVFADQVAEVVDAVYAGGNHNAIEYLIAIYGFSVQIYNDFSGYTDMAIGLALIIGVRLPNNFRRPYISASVSEFWRRWHITLSFWLRDYIYKPLGGNRQGSAKQFRNVMLTMTIGGLWHGANWTFVLWGILHGLFIGLSHLLNRLTPWRSMMRVVPRWLAIVVTFHIVTLLWIPFRAPNMETAWRVLSGPFKAPLGDVGGTLALHAWPLVLIAVFFLVHRFDRHATLRFLRARLKPVLLWSIVAVFWAVAIAVNTGSSAKFIYFDF